MELTKKEKVVNVSKLVKISMLSAAAGVLALFKFPIPIAPPFMTVDFGDVATLISGFALGPISGIITVVMKNIINLLLNGTTTAYVGELSNTIVGCVFVGSASFIYSYKKTKKRAAIGLIVGVILMTLVATLSNYYVIFPLYAKAMGIELIEFTKMMPPNNYIHSFLDLILFAIVPFNLVKGTLNALVTLLIYKKISQLLK